MVKPTLILRHFLPYDAVSTGNLVLDVRHPEQEFFTPEAGCILDKDIVTQHLENFSYVMDQTKGSGLHAYLTTFFSTSSSSQRTSNINISSASCITRQLKNPGTIFEQMCGSNRTRAWLERAMRRNKPVYMVSGIQSLVDTQVNESDERVLQNKASAKMPATLASAISPGAAIPSGETLDFGVGMSRNDRSNERMKFSAPGEQIFAVQYRKIRFSRFSRNDVDDAYLQLSSRWKIYMGSRGGDGTEQVKDIVDAQASEDLQLDDIKYQYFKTVNVDGEDMMYLT